MRSFKGDPLPYAERHIGCAASLKLSKSAQHTLLRRVVIKPDAPTIHQIESEPEQHLLMAATPA